mmetsp:Transcript_4671/g.9136  ORF Transcript_4671/g.9136 Transcript_4671/m.9136 type:complete len:85 (+) Transcript_4671:738-992(+)
MTDVTRIESKQYVWLTLIRSWMITMTMLGIKKLLSTHLEQKKGSSHQSEKMDLARPNSSILQEETLQKQKESAVTVNLLTNTAE